MPEIKMLIIDASKNVKIRRMIAMIVFIAISAKSFLFCTYLFRNADMCRIHSVGIKEEKPLDMVYLGASDVYVYWQPLKAWNDYGFTSYNMAVNRTPSESIQYFIKETLKYHKPELFVISARSFQYDWGGIETDLRNSSDSLEFSLNRWKLIREYLENRTINGNVDNLSFYFDIIKYHTNYSALASKANWDLINNKGTAMNKGFEWIPSYQYLTPMDFETNSRNALSEINLKTLHKVLNFCKEKELKVLFVVCPYQITAGEQAQYNTIKDIVTSYGFGFLNGNEYYDEMRMDFSRDFYHSAHVNCYGAEKYTEFLGNYIMEHYELPDHREEDVYAGWNEDFIRFTEEESDTKEKVDALILAAQEGKKIADSIRETTDFGEWCILAKDTRFTILAVGDEGLSDLEDEEDRKALALLGLDTLKGTSNYIRVTKDTNIIYTNLETYETEYIGIVGYNSNIPNCTLKNSSNQELSIKVNGEECSRKESGINIVIYENDYNYVVDSVTLKCDDEGKIQLIR